MGVLYWKRHRRGRSFGPRRRGGLPVDTPQLDGATPLCVAAPRKNETRSPGDIAAKSRSSQDVEVSPSKCAIPCGGCCGSPLGRGGPGGPSSSPAAAPPRPRQLFSDRRKGFSENPNVFSEKSNFLASLILPGWAAEMTDSPSLLSSERQGYPRKENNRDLPPRFPISVPMAMQA